VLALVLALVLVTLADRRVAEHVRTPSSHPKNLFAPSCFLLNRQESRFARSAA
jgi:hypothetical protein